MQSICKQPEDTFIKMASLKIDFYFEVFKQLKNHVLSISHMKENLFIDSLMKIKTYLAVHLTSGKIFLVNLLADSKAADSTPKYSLLAGDTNQASIFLLA